MINAITRKSDKTKYQISKLWLKYENNCPVEKKFSEFFSLSLSLSLYISLSLSLPLSLSPVEVSLMQQRFVVAWKVFFAMNEKYTDGGGQWC